MKPPVAQPTPRIGIVDLEGLPPEAVALWDALKVVALPPLPEPLQPTTAPQQGAPVLLEGEVPVRKADLARVLSALGVQYGRAWAWNETGAAAERLCEAAGLS